MEFTAAAGIGSIAFKLVFGPIVDQGLLKLRPALTSMVVIGSLTFFITPWLDSYWQVMVNAAVCVGVGGVTASLNDTFVRETLGVDLLVCVFSWMELLLALLAFAFGFFPGKWDGGGRNRLDFKSIIGRAGYTGCIKYT